MRLGDLDPRRAPAERSDCSAHPPIEARRSGLPVCLLFALVLGTGALAGCELLIPMPEAALLRPQPPPKCDQRPAPAATDDGDAAKLKKLDYEAQCFRHAEMIARNRLGRLQASIREQARAAKESAKAAQRNASNNP